MENFEESVNAAFAENKDGEEAREVNQNTTKAARSTVDEEFFKKVMEVYNGDKRVKQDLWSSSMIDDLENYVNENDKLNFNEVAIALEAANKLYSLRVDDVHNDTQRMANGLNHNETDGASAAGHNKNARQETAFNSNDASNALPSVRSEMLPHCSHQFSAATESTNYDLDTLHQIDRPNDEQNLDTNSNQAILDSSLNPEQHSMDFVFNAVLDADGNDFNERTNEERIAVSNNQGILKGTTTKLNKECTSRPMETRHRKLKPTTSRSAPASKASGKNSAKRGSQNPPLNFGGLRSSKIRKLDKCDSKKLKLKETQNIEKDKLINNGAAAGSGVMGSGTEHVVNEVSDIMNHKETNDVNLMSEDDSFANNTSMEEPSLEVERCVTDMKNLTDFCAQIINNDLTEKNETSFKQVQEKLPNVMGDEHVSTAMTFSAILDLASSNNLILQQGEDLTDFTIEKRKDE